MSGKKIMPLLDPSTIHGTDIAMFVAQDDSTCPYALAEDLRDKIGSPVKSFYTIPHQDHGYFVDANDHDFMENLMSELVEPVVASAVSRASIAFTSFVLSAAMLAWRREGYI